MTESIDAMLAKLTGSEVAHLTADAVPASPKTAREIELEAFVSELEAMPTAELRRRYSEKTAAYYKLELEEGYKMKSWMWEADQCVAIIERRILHDGETVEGWTLSGYYR